MRNRKSICVSVLLLGLAWCSGGCIDGFVLGIQSGVESGIAGVIEAFITDALTPPTGGE